MNKTIILCTLIAYAGSAAAIADNKDLLTMKNFDAQEITLDSSKPKSANSNDLRFTQIPSQQDIKNEPSDMETNQPSEFTCKPKEYIVLEKQDGKVIWCGTNEKQGLFGQIMYKKAQNIYDKILKNKNNRNS